MAELVLDVLADLDVLEQVIREVALVEPVRLPVVDVADAEALRMHLLAHYSTLLLKLLVTGYSFGVSATVRWLVRFRIR
jgi:hypothetical protein